MAKVSARNLAKAKKIFKAKMVLRRAFEKQVKAYFAQCKAAIKTGHHFPSSYNLITNYEKKLVQTIFRGHDQPVIMDHVRKANEPMVAMHYKSIDRTTAKYLKQARAAAKEAGKELKDEFSDTADDLTTAQIFDRKNKNRVVVIAVTESTALHNKSRLNTMRYSIPELKTAMEEEDDEDIKDIQDLNDNDTIDGAVESYRAGDELTDVFRNVSASYKQWVCYFDNSCEICINLDGVVVAWDEPFPDYEEPGAVHIGCHCDEVFTPNSDGY